MTKREEETRESLRVKSSKKAVNEKEPFVAFMSGEIEGHWDWLEGIHGWSINYLYRLEKKTKKPVSLGVEQGQDSRACILASGNSQNEILRLWLREKTAAVRERRMRGTKKNKSSSQAKQYWSSNYPHLNLFCSFMIYKTNHENELFASDPPVPRGRWPCKLSVCARLTLTLRALSVGGAVTQHRAEPQHCCGLGLPLLSLATRSEHRIKKKESSFCLHSHYRWFLNSFRSLEYLTFQGHHNILFHSLQPFMFFLFLAITPIL